jgi:hypothetical protein
MVLFLLRAGLCGGAPSGRHQPLRLIPTTSVNYASQLSTFLRSATPPAACTTQRAVDHHARRGHDAGV